MSSFSCSRSSAANLAAVELKAASGLARDRGLVGEDRLLHEADRADEDLGVGVGGVLSLLGEGRGGEDPRHGNRCAEERPAPGEIAAAEVGRAHAGSPSSTEMCWAAEVASEVQVARRSPIVSFGISGM